MSVIDDLLAFDDEPELLAFRFAFGNLLALPAFRWNLCVLATERALGWQPSFAEREPMSLRDRAAFFARAAWDNPFRIERPFELVIFGTSAGAVIRREERWFDRINDYFAMEYAQRTLVAETAYRGRYKRPRFPPHVCSRDAFSLLAAARARLVRPSGADESMVKRLVQFLVERFPVPLERSLYDGIAAALLGVGKQLPFLHRLYQRFFERARPKVLFVEDGSYGGMGPVLAWARDAGVATAEFQHGLIAPSHLAYNYGIKLRNDAELSAQMPQHLLVYGDYWAAQVRTPSRPVVIGWPHFSVRVDEHRARKRVAGASLLIISQGTATDLFVGLTEQLAARLPSRHIIFRLHPGEVPFRERWQKLTALRNVQISSEGDIYDCFADADAVVGHSSTALVEAAGLGLAVFVVDDKSSRLLVPPGLGKRFCGVDELAASLAKSSASPTDTEQLAASDWRGRYGRFVESLMR